MIDGNISMEEDTELRDLVVQTLENNGVLAKVRAQLRASVFLTLEEQESVLNPEPFLNKSVKQYLGSSEGKLLFSLVREFLEYFGLDYTISVYDLETYFGKEYNYVGRKKLCEELGINSKEPLLGEILKNTFNSALNNTDKSESSNIKVNKTNESLGNVNATFDITDPKILQNDLSSTSIDSSEKVENISSNLQLPINVTITDKKQSENLKENDSTRNPISREIKFSDKTTDIDNCETTKEIKDSSENEIEKINKVDSEVDLNIHHSKLSTRLETHQNQESFKSNKNFTEIQTVNNVKNKKQVESINNIGKTVFFDEIIVDGIKEKVTTKGDGELLLGELPLLTPANNSAFSDLPPLNGKKANMNDLKELMDIAQGVSKYEEDFISSTSGNMNEQSPTKMQSTSESLVFSSHANNQDFSQNVESENESEEIHEEIHSNSSCLENIVKLNAESSPKVVTANCID